MTALTGPEGYRGAKMHITVLSTPVIELRNFNPDWPCKPDLLSVVTLVIFLMIVIYKASALFPESCYHNEIPHTPCYPPLKDTFWVRFEKGREARACL